MAAGGGAGGGLVVLTDGVGRAGDGEGERESPLGSACMRKWPSTARATACKGGGEGVEKRAVSACGIIKC